MLRVAPPAPRNIVATAVELALFLREAPPHLRVWLLMCSDLAIRSGTAAVMAPQHYDQGRRLLTFRTKHGREMALPVTSELAAMLDPLTATADDPTKPFVCMLHPWGHIHDRNLRQSFRRLQKRLGVSNRVRPHDLRRTTAVNVLEITKDIRAVQAVLGHKDLQSTLHYLDHRNTPVERELLERAKEEGRSVQTYETNEAALRIN